jgi:hypothetical protein
MTFTKRICRTMGMPLPSIDPLADLRPNYVERLRTRIASLVEFLDHARQGEFSGDAISDSHRSVHSMISSAAIFGHADLSSAARAAEQAFEHRMELGDESLINRIETLLVTANEVLHVYEKPRH